MKSSSTRWVAGAMSGRVRRLRPVVCVDLGFSAKRETTGIAVLPMEDGAPDSSRNFAFGAAINYVAQVIHSSQEGVLILEAPLSACFSSEGNPCPREQFEWRILNGKKATRYWYSGAGATMMLASHFFLRELDKQLSGLQHRGCVHVFEGFLSFKAGASKHKSDAGILLKTFLRSDGVRQVKPRPGERLISIFEVLNEADGSSVAPDVVLVEGPV